MAFRKSGVRVRRTPIVIVLIATSRRSFVCEGHACSHAPAKTSHPMIAAGFCFAGHGTMHPFSIRTARGCCSAPSRLWECGGGFAAAFPKLHATRYEIAAEGRTHDALHSKSVCDGATSRQVREDTAKHGYGGANGQDFESRNEEHAGGYSRGRFGRSSGRGRVMVPPSASRWRVCGLLLRERGAAGNSIRHAKSLRGDHRLGALA
jgi:hypothetical protein